MVTFTYIAVYLNKRPILMLTEHILFVQTFEAVDSLNAAEGEILNIRLKFIQISIPIGNWKKTSEIIITKLRINYGCS